MSFIKKNYKFIIFFTAINAIYFLCSSFFYDAFCQYGMAHAIANGELPYKDFNTVTTPLYIYLNSIPLLFIDDFSIFLIFNAFLVTIMYFFLDKIIEKKALIVISLALFPIFDFLCPSYNLLCKVLMVILLYLEKEKKPLFLIGVFIGLLILTKHTVGLSLLLIYFIYKRNLKDIIKITLGTLIPVGIFLLYLFIFNLYRYFIDLCFLGLGSFSKNNLVVMPQLVVILVISCIYLLWRYIKGERSYLFYYAVASIAFVIPICDYNHFCIYLFFFLIYLFSKINLKINYSIISVFLFVTISFFAFSFVLPFYRGFEINNINHFHNYILFFDSKYKYERVLEKYKSYDNSAMVYPSAVIYDVSAEKKITYLDVPLTGNFGHRGTDKMIDIINEYDYVFIKRDYKHHAGQFDYDAYCYVRKNGTLVDSVMEFDIYKM